MISCIFLFFNIIHISVFLFSNTLNYPSAIYTGKGYKIQNHCRTIFLFFFGYLVLELKNNQSLVACFSVTLYFTYWGSHIAGPCYSSEVLYSASLDRLPSLKHFHCVIHMEHPLVEFPCHWINTLEGVFSAGEAFWCDFVATLCLYFGHHFY